MTHDKWIQYENAPTINEIVASLADSISPTADIDSFYEDYFDIDTCNDYGLERWGNVVGIGRNVDLNEGFSYGFGFYIESLPANEQPYQPLGYGVFAKIGITSNYRVATSTYRRMIKAKALSNILRPTIPAINQVLKLLTNSQKAYVIDNQDMTVSYTPGAGLVYTEFGKSLLRLGIVPRPIGVDDGYQPPPNDLKYFGFFDAGDLYAPIGFGIFYK